MRFDEAFLTPLLPKVCCNTASSSLSGAHSAPATNAAEIGRNPVSKHTSFSLSVENEQGDAGRTRLARPSS